MAHQAILVDISTGTCRASIMTDTGSDRPVFSVNREYTRADYATFDDLLNEYLAELGDDAPTTLALVMSGLVSGDVLCPMWTSWTISRKALAEKFGLLEAFTLNHVSATAASLPWLEQRDVVSLGGHGDVRSLDFVSGSHSIVSVGQGLGAAATKCDHGEMTVIDSEAGHMNFAPRNATERKILEILTREEKLVSCEDMCSKRGIEGIYQSLCEINEAETAALSALEVILYGRTGADPICEQAISIMTDILAAFAGDCTLSMCTLDGAFITGEIFGQLTETIDINAFRNSFVNKAKFSDNLATVPLFGIVNKSAALLGLGRIMMKRMREECEKTSSSLRPTKPCRKSHAALINQCT